MAVFTQPDDFNISLISPTPGVEEIAPVPTPEPSEDTEVEDTEPSPKVGRNVYSIDLYPIGSTDVSGVVTILPSEGQSRVILTVNKKGQEYMASIRRGSCSSPGEPVYQLNNISEYSSTSLIDDSFENLRKNLPLAIIVSSDNILSCGNVN